MLKGVHKLSEIKDTIPQDEWKLMCTELKENMKHRYLTHEESNSYIYGWDYEWARAGNYWVGYPTWRTKPTMVITLEQPARYDPRKVLNAVTGEDEKFNPFLNNEDFSEEISWLWFKVNNSTEKVQTKIVSQIFFNKIRKRFKELNTPQWVQIEFMNEAWKFYAMIELTKRIRETENLPFLNK